MNIVTRAFFLLGMLLPPAVVVAQAQQGTSKTIPPSEARALIASRNAPLILDVRTASEYREGHLAGARNMDVTLPTFQQSLNKLDKTKPIIVYCAVGGRSARAAKILEGKGFHVLDLAGGYTAWTQLRYPVQR